MLKSFLISSNRGIVFLSRKLQQTIVVVAVQICSLLLNKTDFEPISELHNLELISLRNTQFEDISLLSNLIKLRSLDLGNCKGIKEISDCESFINEIKYRRHPLVFNVIDNYCSICNFGIYFLHDIEIIRCNHDTF